MSCISLASAVKPQFASDNALNKRSVVIDYSMLLDLCGLCLPPPPPPPLIMLCFSFHYYALWFYHYAHKKALSPHFFWLFSPKIHRQVIATEIRVKQRCLFVYRGAQLSLRKDELALNSILVKVKNFALALCSMLGQGGQQLLKVVGHLAILVGKRPTASSNF